MYVVTTACEIQSLAFKKVYIHPMLTLTLKDLVCMFV